MLQSCPGLQIIFYGHKIHFCLYRCTDPCKNHVIIFKMFFNENEINEVKMIITFLYHKSYCNISPNNYNYTKIFFWKSCSPCHQLCLSSHPSILFSFLAYGNSFFPSFCSSIISPTFLFFLLHPLTLSLHLFFAFSHRLCPPFPSFPLKVWLITVGSGGEQGAFLTCCLSSKTKGLRRHCQPLLACT